MPRFWFSKNIISFLLLPISLIYSLATWLRFLMTSPTKCQVPIICIGNLTVGGTGKTPVCIDIASRLITKKKNPHFLSRGYKGHLKGPLKVTKKHKAEHVGDEPLLLSQTAPCWIGANRRLTAEMATEDEAEFLIMDDGFQNPALHKDLSVIVIDGVIGFGNGFVMPAGPLREPISSGLKRADLAVIIGQNKKEILLPLPTLHATLVPEKVKKLMNKKLIAFTGIGRPTKFFDALRHHGYDITEEIPFPDHHLFNKKELKMLQERAKKQKASLVTTEKDFVRLPKDMQKKVHMIKASLVWDDEEKLEKILEKVINGKTL